MILIPEGIIKYIFDYINNCPQKNKTKYLLFL